jgi:hypothetical protein
MNYSEIISSLNSAAESLLAALRKSDEILSAPDVQALLVRRESTR